MGANKSHNGGGPGKDSGKRKYCNRKSETNRETGETRGCISCKALLIFDQVSEQVSTAAQHGWEQFSHAASSAAEFTTEEVHKIASRFDNSNFEQPQSAMDAASQGRPMNV